MCQALIGLAGAIIGAAAAILAVIIKDNRDQNHSWYRYQTDAYD